MPTYPYTVTITNPGAELGTVTDWPNRFTCAGTQAWAALNASTDGVSARTGSWFFRWGTNTSAANGECQEGGQTITLDSSLHTDLDDGRLTATASVWITKGSSATTDRGGLLLIALDGSDVVIGRWQVTLLTPASVNTYEQQTLAVPLPAGTRKLVIGGRTARPVVTRATAIFADDFTLTLSDSDYHDDLYVNVNSAVDWTEDTPTLQAESGTSPPRWGETAQELTSTSTSVDSTAHYDATFSSSYDVAVDANNVDCTLYFALKGHAEAYSRVGVAFYNGLLEQIGTDNWFLGPTEVTTTDSFYNYYEFSDSVPAGTRTIRLLWLKDQFVTTNTRTRLKDIQLYLTSSTPLDEGPASSGRRRQIVNN